MKASHYRMMFQNKPEEEIDPNVQPLTQLLDHKLYYINRSFEQNIKMQQILLDLVKNKKTIHSKELKNYYLLFTDSKADSLMFNHSSHDRKEDLWENNNNSKELLYSLKRLYCRLIEKTMVKISYYIMNKKYLSFIFNPVNELIKKCEVLMRRLNYLKELSNINEIVEKIYQQNEEIQHQIIEQLINKGYINSIDEFYRINGIDLQHREYYERNKATDESNDKSEEYKAEEGDGFIKRYQINLNGHKNSGISFRIKKSEVSKVVHRTGILQMQDKYKSMVINLQSIMNNDEIEEIQQVKQNQEIQQESADKNKKKEKEIINQFTQQQSKRQNENKQNNDKITATDQINKARESFSNKTSKNSRKNKKKQTCFQVINMPNDSYQDLRSDIHKRQITIHELKQSANGCDSMTKRSKKQRKYSSPFFSKSFINAIKSIDKSNFSQVTCRLSIKRMSEHIISFQKQNQLSSRRDNDKAAINMILRKNNQKKSIMKLLNIYKNRTLQQFVGSIEREYVKNQDNLSSFKGSFQNKNSRQSIYVNKLSTASNNIFNHQNLSAEKKTQKFSSFIAHKSLLNEKKNARNSSMQTLIQSNFIKRNQKLQSLFKQTAQFKKEQSKYSDEPSSSLFLKSKVKMSFKASVFTNPKLINRLPHHSHKPKLSQITSLQVSPTRSPDKSLNSTCLLTSNGIQNINPFKLLKQSESQRSNFLNKTASTSPSDTPFLHKFQVYDRKRRVII